MLVSFGSEEVRELGLKLNGETLCLAYLTIIPRTRMGSEAMRARGIIVLVKFN